MKNLNVPLSLIVGFIGAALFHFVLAQPVQAETQVAPPLAIQAQSFMLVDPKGKIMGTFTWKPSGIVGAAPDVVLYDANGRQVWDAGLGSMPTVR